MFGDCARVDKIRKKKYEATGIETAVSPRFIRPLEIGRSLSNDRHRAKCFAAARSRFSSSIDKNRTNETGYDEYRAATAMKTIILGIFVWTFDPLADKNLLRPSSGRDITSFVRVSSILLRVRIHESHRERGVKEFSMGVDFYGCSMAE